MQAPAGEIVSQYQRNGKWRYHARIQLPSGRKIRIKGTPVTNTKAAAKAAESAHAFRLAHPDAAARVNQDKEVPTVSEFADVFLKGYAADHCDTEKDGKKRMLDVHILPEIGGMRLDEINQIRVDLFRADLLADRGAKSVNNILSVLSSLLKYAAANDLIPTPKIRFITKSVIGDQEIYPVAREDVDKLLEVAPDQRYRVAVLLAAEAGFRIGEIRAHRWVDTNLIGRQFTIARQSDPKNRVRAPKHGRVRKVPMSSRLFKEIQLLPQTGPTLITKLKSPAMMGYFGMRDALEAMYLRAGVTKPSDLWHCLRHTFGTELAANNVPVTEIKKLMGHQRIETTMRYIHARDCDLAKSVARTFG